MKTTRMIALAAAMSLFAAGGAYAAEKAMDCCAKCECCKDKKPDGAAPAQPHDHDHD